MDCRRRSAVDDVRSRRWVADDDRYPWEVDEVRRRRRSMIEEDRRRRRRAVDDDRRRRRWEVDDYSPLELPLKWRDPPPEYPPLELPLKWRNPLPDHLIRNQPATFVGSSPPLRPHSVAHDSASASYRDLRVCTRLSSPARPAPAAACGVHHGLETIRSSSRRSDADSIPDLNPLGDIKLVRLDRSPLLPHNPPALADDSLQHDSDTRITTGSGSIWPDSTSASVSSRNPTQLPSSAPFDYELRDPKLASTAPIPSDHSVPVQPIQPQRSHAVTKESPQSNAMQESDNSIVVEDSNLDDQISDTSVPETETPSDVHVTFPQICISNPTISCGDASSTVPHQPHSHEMLAQALRKNPHRVFLVEDIEQVDFYSQVGIKNAMEKGSFQSLEGEEVAVKDAIDILSCETFDSRSRGYTPPAKQKIEREEGKNAHEKLCAKENTSNICLDLNLCVVDNEAADSLIDQGDGETKLNDSYNIGMKDFIAGVKMACLNFTYKADPTQYSQAVRQNVSEGSNSKFVGPGEEAVGFNQMLEMLSLHDSKAFESKHPEAFDSTRTISLLSKSPSSTACMEYKSMLQGGKETTATSISDFYRSILYSQTAKMQGFQISGNNLNESIFEWIRDLSGLKICPAYENHLFNKIAKNLDTNFEWELLKSDILESISFSQKIKGTALELKVSGHPFIWSIRHQDHKWIPEGYEEFPLGVGVPAHDGRKDLLMAGLFQFTSNESQVNINVEDGGTSQERRYRKFRIVIQHGANLLTYEPSNSLPVEMKDAAQPKVSVREIFDPGGLLMASTPLTLMHVDGVELF